MPNTRLTHYCERNPERGAMFALFLILAVVVVGSLIDNEQLWSNL